jgi:hypothetical protein
MTWISLTLYVKGFPYQSQAKPDRHVSMRFVFVVGTFNVGNPHGIFDAFHIGPGGFFFKTTRPHGGVRDLPKFQRPIEEGKQCGLGCDRRTRKEIH